MSSFEQRFRAECLTGSAIAPEAFEAAISFIEDAGRWEPNHALGHQVSRFWERRQPHSFEEIACFRQEDGSIWQAKPKNPRLDWQKTRKRLERMGWRGGVLSGIAQHLEAAAYQKYEFPKGKGSAPYLPPVPASIRQRIAARYGCDVPLAGSFWDWVGASPDIPIAITEGGKKALALLSLGYVAISLVGVNGGYRSKDALGNSIQPHLIPDLERFCQPGRPVLLAFDQDTEASTRKRVTSALFRFGGLLARAGCSVKLALWDGSQGKGVDDLIANGGPDAFHQAADQALTLDEFRLKLALDNRLSGIAPALRVSTRDLSSIAAGDIPQSGIIAISSAKGTGKTKLIGGMVAGASPALLAGHRIALARNLCSRLGIRYRGDLDRAQGRFTDGSGYVMRVGTVVDSLLAINPADFEGCDLIIDESVQVLRHLLTSATCNKDGRRPVLLARFAELVRSARRVILADADLDRASIQYIQALRGDERQPWLLLNDAKVDPWPVDFIEAPDASAITAQLMRDIRAGRRVFIATDSKAGSKKLERLITQIEGIGANVLLLNSETSGGEIERGVIENPIRVADFRAVIASPSLGTGWSDESEHFERVYGIFWGASSTDADMAQALARVRRSVPRVVWVAERGNNFSRIGRDTNPLRLKRLLQDKSNATAQLTAASIGALGAEISGYDWLNPHAELWAAIEAGRNRSMLALRSALKVRLLHEGHALAVRRLCINDAAREALRQARQDIEIMQADAVANAANISATEARALESCEVLSPEERLSLHKWRLAQFYALPLEEVTPDLVLADKDGRRRSQLLNLENFMNPELAAEADIKALGRQAQWAKGITPWDVPHARLRSELRLKLGLDVFLQDGIEWNSANLEAFKARCLEMAAQIKAVLNLTIREADPAAKVLGHLLDQIGLSTESRQIREGEKRSRQYWLSQQAKADAFAILERRAKARQNAEGGAVTHPPLTESLKGVCDTANPLLQADFSPEDLEDIRLMKAEAARSGAAALDELKKLIPPPLWNAA